MENNSGLAFYYLLFISILVSCTPDDNSQYRPISPSEIHACVNNLSDIVVHDIFSPPVASRVYVYPCIAAYEVLIHAHPNYTSLALQVKDLTPVPKPDTTKQISFEIAAIHAFNTVAKSLIFSEDKMEAFQTQQRSNFKDQGCSKRTIDHSFAYGEIVANHILDWADKDQYKQTRTFPKFTINDKDSRWKPTPPAYMDGIEPHWREIRPFVIDSAQQFSPPPPSTFDMNANSAFHKELMEVYETVNNLSEEEKEIASFWDCNPYVMNIKGHVMFATKKITPGGHWMGIVEVACKKDSATFIKSVHAYALTSIALADAFISCWDEKYRSNLVRPETIINEVLDESWVPLLQTPPFPEHTSGHSVISRASATVLTAIFGDDFSFSDDVEVKYGLPIRNFTSFYHASEEAAISRLYGGIHYRPAIDYGMIQGQKVGDYINENLKTKID